MSQSDLLRTALELIENLQNVVEHLQSETAAHKLLIITLLSTLADQPDQVTRLKQVLTKAAEGDQASALNLPLPDAILQQRTARLLEMLPPALRPCVAG